jgi:CheY-like chemotaxis protein
MSDDSLILDRAENKMFIYFRFETTAKIQELEAAGMIVRDSQAATRKATAGNAGHNQHHLLIMALTADVFSNNHAKVKKCGMDGSISKPLQEDQLYISLHDFLPSTPLLPDPSELQRLCKHCWISIT